MKFILIATALNLQLTYPSEDICNVALESVQKKDSDAFCIPAPVDHVDEVAQRIQNTALMILQRKMSQIIAEEEKLEVDQTQNLR